MKHLVLWILLLVLFLTCVGCAQSVSYHAYVRDLCGLDLADCGVVSSKDTHGGFHGDGALMVEFDCSQISDFVLQQISAWHPLPLSENLRLIMYGGVKNDTVYAHKLAEHYGLPEVRNGYYFFHDRHAMSTDPASDRDLLSRGSWNFTLLIFNADTAHLYLFEYDT